MAFRSIRSRPRFCSDPELNSVPKPVLHVEWSINGTIDRVTGDVEATSTQTAAKTLQNVSSLAYTLKCRPTQRLF
jgi:hypothetical protein